MPSDRLVEPLAAIGVKHLTLVTRFFVVRAKAGTQCLPLA